MFVFFEFFTLFFKKLWINHLNHLSRVPACIPKSADGGASLWRVRVMKRPLEPPLAPTALGGC